MCCLHGRNRQTAIESLELPHLLDHLPLALHQEMVVQRRRHRDRLRPAGWRRREPPQMALPGLQLGARNHASGFYLLVRERVRPYFATRPPSILVRANLLATAILSALLL